MADDGKTRCWNIKSVEMLSYHDSEWGWPEINSAKLFAILSLQAMQSGLSWKIVLNKRPALFRAFKNFDFRKVAKFTEKEIKRLSEDPTIIRNPLKIRSIVSNAKIALDLETTFPGGFSGFVWSHAPQEPKEIFISVTELPVSHMRTDFKTSPKERLISDGVHPTVSCERFANACKKRGLKFVGPTTILSFFQAAGLVNHHPSHCFRFHEINQNRKSILEGVTITTIQEGEEMKKRTKTKTLTEKKNKSSKRKLKGTSVKKKTSVKKQKKRKMTSTKQGRKRKQIKSSYPYSA